MRWIILCMVWGNCLYADDTIHAIRLRSGLFHDGPMQEVRSIDDTLRLVHLKAAGRAQSQTMRIPINEIDWIIYSHHAERWHGTKRIAAPIIRHRTYTNIESMLLGVAAFAVAAHYAYVNKDHRSQKEIKYGASILGGLFTLSGIHTETTYALPDGTFIGHQWDR